ncbi:MAG: acyltransferase family protein [Microthrixaceae bacterium]
MPSLDGMRGIGVAMVLVGHALFEYLESWVTIVDTFFVLSAFLIVTLLLQEANSTGRVRIGRFYQRRALRLLPSLALFVATWLVVAAIGTVFGVEGLSLARSRRMPVRRSATCTTSSIPTACT